MMSEKVVYDNPCLKIRDNTRIALNFRSINGLMRENRINSLIIHTFMC